MTDTAPNVLILFADQLRADALGCYDGRIAVTPALDGLAETGTIFDSAYTPSPVCVPARSAFITGWEPQHGDCFENEMPTSPATTFMDRLTQAGYRTHGIGKMHFTPDLSALRGFETREIGEEFGTPESDDYLRFVADSGFDFVEYPHGLRDEMYYVPQLSPVPEHLHHSHWVADRSVSFLENVDRSRPFLLWSSFIAPHPPFAPPSPWHRRFEPSVMPDPFVPAGSSGLLTIYNTLQNRYKYRDGGADRHLEQLRRAYYFASVSYLDSQIARILSALDACGLRENTVIIVAADHGEFLGDYGAYGKRSFLDAAARIPLVVSGPGFPTQRRSDPVTLLDVHATIMAIAGAVEEDRDGVDLRSVESDRHVFGQYQQGSMGMYAVIGEAWKYVWSAFDRREYLIDRIHDPHETNNLAYNVRRRDVLEIYRRLAREHFDDLRAVDLDAESDNVALALGERPSPEALAALRSLRIDRDAGTLVVRDESWLVENS